VKRLAFLALVIACSGSRPQLPLLADVERARAATAQEGALAPQALAEADAERGRAKSIYESGDDIAASLHAHGVGSEDDFFARRVEGMFEHHLWATEVLIGHLDRLPAEQLDASVPGTYGSMIDTLTHMIEVHASREMVRRITGRRAEPQALVRVGRRLHRFIGQR